MKSSSHAGRLITIHRPEGRRLNLQLLTSDFWLLTSCLGEFHQVAFGIVRIPSNTLENVRNPEPLPLATVRVDSESLIRHLKRPGTVQQRTNYPSDVDVTAFVP